MTAAPATADEALVDVAAHPVTAARYTQLRALQVGAAAGWYEYLGGQGAEHVLRVGAAVRHLHRDEAYWWVLGVADTHNQARLITALTGHSTPALLTVAEAAPLLPHQSGVGHLSPAGVEYHIRTGLLYPLPGPNRQLLLFAAQVAAVATVRTARLTGSRDDAAAARAAAAVWRRIRAGLPPTLTLELLTDSDDLRRSTATLPIPVGQPEATRQVQALILAHNLGLCHYHHPLPDGDGYVVAVTSNDGWVKNRTLPPVGVLPWVLGVADRAGKGALVRYRRGL